MGLNNNIKSTYINIYTYNIPYSVWLGNGGTDEVSCSVNTFLHYSFIYLKPVKTLRFFDTHINGIKSPIIILYCHIIITMKNRVYVHRLSIKFLHKQNNEKRNAMQYNNVMQQSILSTCHCI